MLRLMHAAVWLLATVAPLCRAQTAAPPVSGISMPNEWELANLGKITGPPRNSTFVRQRAQLLARAGAAAQAAVEATTQNINQTLLASLTSFVATSPGNGAAPGETNLRGLLIYQPRNAALDAIDFQTFFAAAFSNASVPGIKLGPATGAATYFINNNEPNFHINLFCFNRPNNAAFELDLTGVTLFFGNYQLGGIGFFFCQNFFFHGPFNFMYVAAALPFSQGTITAYTFNPSTGQAVYTVQTDAGYPTTTTGLGDGMPHLCVQYYPNGTIVTNSSDIYTDPATVLNAATGLYQFTAPGTNNVRVGNKLAIRGNAGNHGIIIYKGVNFRLERMFQYTAPIFGILDLLSTNSTISSNIIQPWPQNIGTTRPLLSTNADGIHSGGGYKVGPTIVSNQILSPGDDGIANHGAFYTVYSADPSTNSLIVFSSACNNDFCASFFVGDTVRLYSAPYTVTGSTLQVAPGAYTLLGEAPLASTTLLNVAPGGPPGGGNGGPSVYSPVNYNNGFYYRFTFASFPAGFAQATKDGLVSNAAANGDNFAISRNVVTNHRARSIFNKGSNGVISGNVVQQPTVFGLLMTPDLFFLESDFSQNVSVLNNYFNVSGFGPVGQYIQNPADGSLLITQNFKNISYVGNTLDNAGTWAAAVSSTAGISLVNNLVTNAGCFQYVFGKFTPFVPDRSLLFVGQSSSVTLTNNKFITNRGCNAAYGNYVAPISADNVTLTSN